MSVEDFFWFFDLCSLRFSREFSLHLVSNFNQFESNWAAAMAWGVKHVFHYACKIERTNVCWRLFPVLWPVLSSTNHLQCPTDKCQKSMCNPCFNRFRSLFEFKGCNLTLLARKLGEKKLFDARLFVCLFGKPEYTNFEVC